MFSEFSRCAKGVEEREIFEQVESESFPAFGNRWFAVALRLRFNYIAGEIAVGFDSDAIFASLNGLFKSIESGEISLRRRNHVAKHDQKD